MAPRGRKPKQATAALALGQALTFTKTAFHAGSELPNQTHTVLKDGFAIAFDGQIAAGHPIEEEGLSCAPRTDLLLNAINKAGNTLALAQLPTGRLSVKGEKLNALVPCCPLESLPSTAADPQLVPLDERVRKGFAAIGGLVSEAATDVLGGAILLKNDTMIAAGVLGAACNTVVEYFHGNYLPPNLVIPKKFVAAVLKHTMPLTGFGATFDAEGRAGSITFYFEGGSWLKTLTYADKYPDTDRFFDPATHPTYPVPIPAGMIEAIEAVYPFGEYEDVYFKEGFVQSHAHTSEGAQYPVEGLPGGKRFDGDLFKKTGQFMKHIDLVSYPDRMYFFGGGEGEMVRGIMMAMHSNEPKEQVAAAASWQAPTAQAWEQPVEQQGVYQQPDPALQAQDDYTRGPPPPCDDNEHALPAPAGGFAIITAEPEPEPVAEAPAYTAMSW